MIKKLLLVIILLVSAMGLKAQNTFAFTDLNDGAITLNKAATNINSHYAYTGSTLMANYSAMATDNWKLQFGTSDKDFAGSATNYSSSWVIEVFDGAQWDVIFSNGSTSTPAPPIGGWTDKTGGLDAILTISQTNVSCNGASNGTASVYTSSNFTPTSYSWSPNISTTATANGLSPNTYTVTVKDATLTSMAGSVTITQPTTLAATTSETDATIYGGANGTATVIASGGTSPYTYSWAPSGGTAATATGLTAGTYSVTITDANSCSLIKSITVSQPAPLIVSTSSGNASFVAGDNVTSTPVNVDGGITITDAGSSTLASATVAITGSFQSGKDVLAFTNDGATMGNIAASYNATTGVLTLTSSGATATLAQWQSALRSITYTNTAVTPNNATRTISFIAVDGAGNTSSTATRTVTITDTDQTPIVTTTGGTTGYVGSTSPVTIDGVVSVSDLDNSTQASGTVSITSGFHSGDILSFTNDGSTMGNITASYNATTGVLTLTSAGATATLAQWDSALSAVAFSSTSTTYGNRTISFAVSDGTKTSTARTDAVNMTAPPQITTDSGSAAFVAGDNTASTPVAVDSGIILTDGSASTLASATVAITGGFQSGKDVLAFTNDGATMGNIAASYNATTGVLTLTSSGAAATLAQWQSALQSITYTNTAVTPNNATRTISFTAVDGASNTSNTATRTITVTDTDQSPIVTTTGGTTNYVPGTSAATIDGGITVNDADNTTQASGTVSITSGFHPGDTETFINSNSTTFGNIVGSYNASTGVLTLTSSGDVASNTQWSNALSAVKFSASSSAIPGNRTISFAVNDGTKTSAVKTDIVDIIGPPTITTDAGSAAFVAGDNVASTPVVIDPGLTVTDGAGPTLASVTVSITGNFHSGEDVLAFTNTSASTFGNISASYNAATGVLTLSSSGNSATLAQWQAALDAVTYTDTAVTPNNSTRTISFTAVDASAVTSNTATRTVTVTATDQTPIVTTTGGTTNYVGGTSAVTIDGGVSVTDQDNATQSFGTVSISTGFNSGDALSFMNTNPVTFGNIVASYNSATGVLIVTSSGATASDAQWSNALRAVKFSSTSTTGGNRTISFTVNDGTKDSMVATDVISVQLPPTITLSPATLPTPTVGVPYSQSITASGGTAPYTYNVTLGALPPGLSLNSSTGSVSGTPTSGVTDTFTISATDSSTGTGPYSASTIYTVTANAPTIVIAPATLPAATVGASYSQALIASGGTAPYTYSVTTGSLPPGLTLSGGVLSGTPTTAGSYNFTIFAGDSSNGRWGGYAGSQSYMFTVNVPTPAITFNPLPNKTYGDIDFSPGATSTNIGTLIIYTSSNTNVATIVNGNIHITGVGTTTIIASQAADANYNAAADMQQTLTVNQAAITVTATAQSKTYGGTDPAFTYTFSPALVAGDSFTGSLSRTAGESVGTYAINQGTLTLNSNYNLTYTGANLTINSETITVTANAQSKTYGGTDPALTYTFSPALVAGDSFTGSLSRTAGESVGTYAINQGTLALNGNYNLTYTGANLAITPATITVTVTAQSKTYGGTDPALTYIFSPALVAGDSFTGSLSRTAGESVGTYAINQGTLALNSNYNLTYTGANLAITPATITVTATAQSKTYGGTDPAFTYTFSPALVAGDSFTGSLSRTSGENVGTYTINQGTLALNSNYNLTYTGANLTISQATLTVTADDQTRTYGSANPVLTAHYSGFINGDDASKFTTAPSLTTMATTTSAAGSYTVTPSGAAIPNYTIAYQSGTLTVTKAPLTITADNQSRPYGTANSQLTTSYSGFVNGDDASKLTTAATASTTAGTNTAPGAYPITASGAASPNYSFTYVPGTLTITPLKDDSLSGLVVNNGKTTLSPDFSSGVYSYSATVENQVDNINITPQFGLGATAEVNGSTLSNNSASGDIPLQVGNNTITITVTAQDGSQHTYTMNIYRGMSPSSITATNILTPNGDGKNDTWLIKDIDLYPDNIVSVYDRAGRLVYTKRGYQNDWDGTAVNGSPLSQGTYYFTVYLGNDKTTLKGFITIIRE